MGRNYYVPRSVKGESRILYIFTLKSFITTIVFGIIGVLIWNLLGSFIGMTGGLIITGVFGAIGFAIGALKIPDASFVGPLRKAGGEYILDIIFRAITFRFKKKIYVYNYDRKEKNL